MKAITLLLILILPAVVFSQADEKSGKKGKSKFYFFTSNTLFVPTETSIFESRISVTRFIDKKELKLDIGASMDMIGYMTGSNTYSAGVDFFTFSSLRTESNFKFPVDAIDYMFGVNFNFKNENNLSSRLRISHISSHFEDGHIYERTDTIFTPVVYSKEFINLAVIKEWFYKSGLCLKIMAAGNFNFHAIPETISKLSGQLGLEARYILNGWLNCYISNDLNISSVNSSTNANENFEAGFSFGKINTRNINLYFEYYDGQDYRGQYYGKYLNYKSIGLRFKI